MNTQRTNWVYWLTFISCNIGLWGLLLTLGPQWHQDTNSISPILIFGLFSHNTAHAVVQRFGLSLEDEKTENMPVQSRPVGVNTLQENTENIIVPASPVAPPHSTRIDIYSQSDIMVVTVFQCAITLFFWGIVLSALPDSLGHLPPFCWILLGIPFASLGAGYWIIRQMPMAWVNAEGALSNGKFKRHISWRDVTGCSITRGYSMTGRLNKCVITLVDERNHTTVVLFMTAAGPRKAEQVMHFVRWKLSQQAARPQVSEKLT